MWSADVDPRVIVARAGAIETGHPCAFDGVKAAVRALRGPAREYLLVDRGGVAIRLDVIEGTVLADPVSLNFDLANDGCLESRVASIRAFVGTSRPSRPSPRLARGLHALDAADAYRAGASLREVADLILGPGDWPGEGEYRKSLVRRLIATGARMMNAGPRLILSL